jgi:hypothetical protein
MSRSVHIIIIGARAARSLTAILFVFQASFQNKEPIKYNFQDRTADQKIFSRIPTTSQSTPSRTSVLQTEIRYLLSVSEYWSSGHHHAGLLWSSSRCLDELVRTVVHS